MDKPPTILPGSISIVSGQPLSDRKSKFIAHLARVHTVEQVDYVLKTLKSNPKIDNATHNIMAYRLAGPDNTTIEARDDDGETGAGDKLLWLLDRLNVLNVVVIVSRWFGGIQLGAARFKHINDVAKQLLIDENLVSAR